MNLISSIEKRKIDHINICLNKNVESKLTTGFERYKFIHNALPEINKEDIDLTVKFLGKKLSYPILISAISGGNGLAKKINRNLAKAAQNLNIAMCLGSQRIAIENLNTVDTFNVRDIAPNIVLLSNLGAVQLNNGFNLKECKRVIDMVRADGLVLHLNPMQEALQPEGNTNFKNLLLKIKYLQKKIKIPVIIKEVGFGISYDIAKKIEQTEIKTVDIAGAGGTSFSIVESYRTNNSSGKLFYDWGISTVDSLIQTRNNTNLKIIASGGIRNGVEMAKAIALGADLVGIGLPLLKPAVKSSHLVEKKLKQFIEELKTTMFCIGTKNLKELKNTKRLVKVK